MQADIVLISPEFGFGGMGNHSMKIAKLLLDEDFNVCIHTVTNKKTVGFTHPNLKVLEVAKPFFGFDVFNPFFDLLSSSRMRRMTELKMIIRVLPPYSLYVPGISYSKIPELAISHGAMYSDANKKLKRAGSAGLKYKYLFSSLGGAVRKSEKIWLDRAKRIVAVSEYTKRNLVDLFGVREEKIRVIRNFIDTSLFKRKEKISSEIGNKLRDFKKNSLLAVFVFGAYPEPSKNIGLLYDILANLDPNINLKFAVVGLDENNLIFKNYVQAMKRLGTLFLGYIDNYLLPDIYSLADFLVVTSTEENLPTVLIEAMACGTIPVCTNAGGIPEVVQNRRNGFLVSPDRNEFVNIFEELVACDSRTLNAISKNAEKEIKEKFDIKNAKKEFLNIVHETISAGWS